MQFDPESWRHGGEAFMAAGEQLTDAVLSRIGELSVEQVGCTKGEHLVDQALCLALPPVLAIFAESAQARGDNIRRVGEAMIATGRLYADTEQAAAAAACQIGDV